jgi:enoyl-CoA hydratase/carnithine racemase
MNPPAWKEAPAVFESLNNDPDIRAIIVAGKGPAFCAGIDIRRKRRLWEIIFEKLAECPPRIGKLTSCAYTKPSYWRP